MVTVHGDPLAAYEDLFLAPFDQTDALDGAGVSRTIASEAPTLDFGQVEHMLENNGPLPFTMGRLT
jgi:hypothetical protein